MKTKKGKKLEFKKETLINLDSHLMENIKGGETDISTYTVIELGTCVSCSCVSCARCA